NLKRHGWAAAEAAAFGVSNQMKWQRVQCMQARLEGGDQMRFGVYTEMQCPPEKPHAQLYWEIQRQIEHADEVGFDVYSTIDHHFSQEFGISANPLALFCAAAQQARRIRFRPSLHVLPAGTPPILAGEIAM